MNVRLFAIICIFVSPWISSTAYAIQASGCPATISVNCDINTGVKTCTAAFVCNAAYPDDSVARPQAIGPNWKLRLNGQSNVTGCSPMGTVTTFGSTAMFSVSAMAATNAPTNRVCSWTWSSNSSAPAGVEARGGVKGGNRIEALFGTITIDTAAGLPVELMEFSLE